MVKDILLYGYIWEYNAAYFHDQLKEAFEEDANAELKLRINSEGGQVDYGYSLIVKYQEIAESFSGVVVEGMAHSMAFFFLVYTGKEKIEAVDTAKSIIHRASYGTWFEKSEGFAGSVHQELLTKTNKDLEKAFRARVDVEAFEALPQMKNKNLKVEDIFSMEARHEVLLSAQDLKKIGLIEKIVKITPSKNSEIKAKVEAFKNCKSFDMPQFKIAASAGAENKKDEKNKSDMTSEQLKAEYPAVYAQIKAEGAKEGAVEEQNRVNAWLQWEKIDAEKVKAAIKDGKAITMNDISEMSAKAASAKALKETEDDSPEETPTADAPPAGEKTKKEKAVASFEAEVDKYLKPAK